jgi:DNA-binding beta-propeller fold protein YncE
MSGPGAARRERRRAPAGSLTSAGAAMMRGQHSVPEWRNWQTRGTQNPVRLKPRAGSTPASGTIQHHTVEIPLGPSLRLTALTVVLSLALPLRAAAQVSPPPFVTSWGSAGTGPGQFLTPVGVALDPAGDVFVIDSNADRLQKFTSGGAFIGQVSSFSGAPGHFTTPSGVAVDQNGDVYVADASLVATSWIYRFDNDNNLITQWAAYGHGIAVDAQGTLWVADGLNTRVRQFSSTGTLLAEWPVPGYPDGVAVGSSGDVYVADRDNNRILVYSSGGVLLRSWGHQGSGIGELSFPVRLALDSFERLYVQEYFNCRIQVFNSGGEYLTQWGTPGSGNGQFANAVGIAVGASGYVYVADTNNSRIQVFGELPTAIRLASWGLIKARYR